jgi:hypothetical protein
MPTVTLRHSLRRLFAYAFIACVALGCARMSASPTSTATASASHRDRPTHDGKVVLFGNLHAHSNLSDDVEVKLPEMVPDKAFDYARTHGLDFLALSDHHKAVDSQHRLFMDPAEYKTQLYEVAMKYNTDHAGEFVAIPAIEWGTEATGNHINAFGIKTLPPDTILDAHYDKFIEWTRTNAEFAQFNHPNSWKASSPRNTTVGNFGEALYPSSQAFKDAADPVVRTVAIIQSISGGHISGPLKHTEKKTHREMQWENYYRYFLNLGFHIAPTADQDTHWKNFGTVTAARTAVWADSVSYADLMKAFKANRVYATEDDEMAVVFQVKYMGKTYWMGETVPLETDEAEVDLLVKVWQGAGSDGDPTDEGPYTVELIVDADGMGGAEAAPYSQTWTAPSGQLLTIPFMAGRGRYLYVHVTEQNGKDNPYGDDTSENDKVIGGKDETTKRQNMNDSAWTAPVWFGVAAAPTGTFVWSKNSNVYHDPNCWAVKNIGAANRREGSAPDGKTKHDCHP